MDIGEEGKENGEGDRRRWRRAREKVFVVSPARGVMAVTTFSGRILASSRWDRIEDERRHKIYFKE